MGSTAIIYTKFLGFCLTLLSCSVFSFLETTITAMRLFKVKEMAKSTSSYKKLFASLEKNPSRVLVTILIASSLANATAAALITDIVEETFIKLNWSGGAAFTLGVGLATTSILIFGEIIPKNLAKVCGDKLFRSTLWLTNMIFYLMYPFVTTLIRFSNYVISKVGGTSDGSSAITSEKEIKFLIDYIDEKGLMDPQKTEMLRGIFELGQTPVKEIMVPWTDVISMNINCTKSEALEMFAKYRFSRLPVYEGKTENIIGMIHQRDIITLFLSKDDNALRSLLRPIIFIPESVKVNQLLREFREKHMHMAMILNEFGSIIGLVTLEDILEEIVGEINDEDETEIQKIIQLEKGGWLVDAKIDLDDLEKVLKITFESENAITLGGFITEQLQRLPQKGERLLFKNLYFQVQKSSRKRVLQVLIFAEKNANTVEIAAEEQV